MARYPKFKKKIIQSSFKLLQKVLLSSIPNEEFVFCVDVAVLPNGCFLLIDFVVYLNYELIVNKSNKNV